MNTGLLQLNGERLLDLETSSGRGDARLFDLSPLGLMVEVVKIAEAATHTHPAEDAMLPDPAECAEAVAYLFAKLLTDGGLARLPAGRRVIERDEPDMAAGWQAYREQKAETLGVKMPRWDQIGTEEQEAFAAAVWAAVEGPAGEIRGAPVAPGTENAGGEG